MDYKKFTLTVVAMFVVCTALIPVYDADAADSGFDVTDGLDRTISFDSPVDHIITIGKGTTATVIELGYLDKISVVDKYSNDKNEPVFEDLNKKVADGEIKAGGTIYSSGIEQLKKDILDSADPEEGGTFDKDKDAIVMTASKTYVDPLVEYFTDKGFKNILVWYDIPEYDLIIDFVDKMSMVLSGEKSDLAEQMRYVSENVKDVLDSNKVTEKKAFVVTFSGGVFKVGNTGSIATSLITAAGGDAYTVNSSKPGPTYEATLPEIYEKGDSPIVFVDHGIWSKADKLDQLETLLPGATLVHVEALWNNFCPDSMYGVWAMACAMYPDLFEGEVPDVSEPEESHAATYAVAGIVIVLVIGVVAYALMKKKKI